MKKRKRMILPILLVLAMLAALTLPAFAESDITGEIEAGPVDENAASLSSGEENPASTENQENTDAPEEEESTEISVPADQGYDEIFVASYGSDSADGSRANPLASLAEAARRANESSKGVVYVLLLTDLVSSDCACFFGHDVYLCSDGETATVTRSQGFLPTWDAARGKYHPAMVECGDVTDTSYTPARLFIDNLILDDAFRHEGELFEEQQPAGEDVDNLAYVHDAIVAAYNGGAAITLGSGAELRNYGGLSAVRATGGSRLTIDDYSAIRDTADAASDRGGRTVWTDNVSLSSYGYRAQVQQRNVSQPTSAVTAAAPTAAQTADSPALSATDYSDYAGLVDGIMPVSSESGLSSLAFAGPKELIRIEDGVLEYEVPYTLSFTLTDSGKNAITASAALIKSGTGTITITLDERLTPAMTDGAPSYSLESLLFEITDIKADGQAIKADFSLKDNWKDQIDKLTEPLTFNCTGILPTENFADGELLSSTGKVDLTIRTDSKSFDLSSPEMTAETKMLPPRSASVVYDANGGEGAPIPAFVSAQTGYELDSETIPTHADANGKPVVFIGWTLERDDRIYAEKEDEPKTVTKIDIEPVTVTTVYAVYGYDENGDGIADVTQTLLTLTYDANGGEGAPDPEVKAATADIGAKFDISETEPTRRYYTFQGWSKDADATEADYKYDADKKADRDLLIVKDTTLYAVWKENPTYTLYYNANGGTNAPDAQSAISEDGYVELKITNAVPTRAGYTFLGWSATRRGNATYYAGDPVRISNGNVMLYAVWEKQGGGSSSGGTGGSPRTGDEAPLDVYAGVMLSCLVAACFFLRVLRRKKPG